MAAPDTRREVTLQADNFEVSVGDDDEHRGVKLGIDNEPFWRVWLTPQGDILTGNGLSPPTAYGGGGGGGGDVATDTIWDAAGDLAVGSGADTAVRLAKGADGTVLSVVAGAVAWATPTVYQALHANLTAFAGLSLVADRLPYADGTGTLALATFTAAGRALVDDADAAAQRSTLGLGSLATQSWPLANTGATAATDAITLDVTGDTQKRIVVNQDGSIEWGSGAAAADISLKRSAANTITIESLTGTAAALIVKGAGGGSGSFAIRRSDNVDMFTIATDGSITLPNGQASFMGSAAGGVVKAITSSATGIPLIVKAAAAQSASYQEWQDSTAAVKFAVNQNGAPVLGSGVPLYAKTAGGASVPVVSLSAAATTLDFAAQLGSVNYTTFGAGLFVINGSTQFAVGFGSLSNYGAKFSVMGGNAAHIVAQYRGATAQSADLVQWQSQAGTALASVSSVGLGLFAGLSITDAKDITFGTTTGTKIGTGATQKIGFWNATPVVQPAAVADATGGTVIDTEARAAINALLARLRTPGIIAT